MVSRSTSAKPNEDNKITNFKILKPYLYGPSGLKTAKRIMCGKCTYLIPSMGFVCVCVYERVMVVAE